MTMLQYLKLCSLASQEVSNWKKLFWNFGPVLACHWSASLVTTPPLVWRDRNASTNTPKMLQTPLFRQWYLNSAIYIFGTVWPAPQARPRKYFRVHQIVRLYSNMSLKKINSRALAARNEDQKKEIEQDYRHKHAAYMIEVARLLNKGWVLRK